MNAAWFAGRLRELREKAGLSRGQLAERAGMKSAAGIRNLEQGVRLPSWETVLALCEALGVSCDAFTQEPGELPPPRAGRPKKVKAPAPKKRKGKK
jgi:transcriptional regulator with XRE-family HTH domain